MPIANGVFVSHCSEDSEWCDTFVELLRQAGADVWYDKENVSVGVLRDVIARELVARMIFIVALSPDAVSKPWVRDEIGVAINLWHKEPERIILPVMARKSQVPEFLKLFVRVNGENNAGLDPVEAAQRVIQMLSFGIPPSIMESAEELWIVSKGLRAQERYRDALIAIEKALNMAPRTAKFWDSKGTLLLDMKWPREALQAFDEAIAYEPESALAWVGKGRALRRMASERQALDAFDHALALDSDLSTALVAKAEAVLDSGEIEEALNLCDRALEVDPDQAVGWDVRSRVLIETVRFDEALAACERSLSYDPTLTAAWNHKIICLVRLGRSDEVQEIVKQRDKAVSRETEELPARITPIAPSSIIIR